MRIAYTNNKYHSGNLVAQICHTNEYNRKYYEYVQN